MEEGAYVSGEREKDGHDEMVLLWEKVGGGREQQREREWVPQSRGVKRERRGGKGGKRETEKGNERKRE